MTTATRRPSPRRRAGTPAVSPAAPPHVPPALDWEVSTSWTCNGRQITPGTELSIAGESGRFRFVRHVRRPNGAEWIDVFGGRQGSESIRSFRPARVRTVHRILKTRANVRP